MSIFKIFQWRGFWAVLFFLFFLFPKDQAFASSWTDVLLSTAACKQDTSCTCWIEEVLVNTAHLFRVWKRCASEVVASTQSYVSIPTFTGGLMSTVSCTNTLVCSLAESGAYCSGYSGTGTTYQINQYCNGSLGQRYNEVATATGGSWGYVSNPCLTNSITGANCKSYDVLFAEFSGLVDNCQADVLSVGQDSFGDYYNVNCACIPERYQVVQYPFTDPFGNVGCKMRSAMGDPILPISDSDTPIQDGSGGSYNTEPSQGGGPDTDGDGTPDTSDTDCSGPGCTITSPPTSTTNPDGTTTTTTTSTTHTGGGIAPTINTTTSTSGTGSTTPGSTTTTTSGPSGSSTTGCIDVNGDGLDDGSGIECSPQGRQFSAPSASYDPTLETLPEDNIPSRLTGWLSQNPYVSVVQGTRVEVSALQCSLSFTLFNKPMAISFCDLQSYVSLFGAVFVGICGIRSVMIALGGE